MRAVTPQTTRPASASALRCPRSSDTTSDPHLRVRVVSRDDPVRYRFLSGTSRAGIDGRVTGVRKMSAWLFVSRHMETSALGHQAPMPGTRSSKTVLRHELVCDSPPGVCINLGCFRVKSARSGVDWEVRSTLSCGPHGSRSATWAPSIPRIAAPPRMSRPHSAERSGSRSPARRSRRSCSRLE